MRGSLLLLTVSLAGASAFAAEPGGVAAKAQYERALEAKLGRLVDDILGPGRGRVFVEASLDQSVTEEAVERLARATEADEALPGFSRPSMGKRLAPELEPVKRLVVKLAVDPSAPAARVTAAQRALAKLVDADRGDRIVSFEAPIAETWDKTLQRPAVRISLAVLASAALALAVLATAAALASRRRARLARLQELVPLSPAGGPVIDARLLPGPNPAVALSGIGPGNLRLVARFLESRPPGAARWLLARLQPEHAAALFRLLPTALRQEAAVEIAKGPPGPAAEAETSRLLEDLHAFLEREAEGPGLLQDLLARSPESLKRAVLESLKLKAPGTLKQVTTGLARFDDLERADASSLAILARETTSEELGLALRGTRPALQTRLLASLPAVLRESALRRARQRAPDESEALNARAAILGRWKELEAAGKVRPL